MTTLFTILAGLITGILLLRVTYRLPETARATQRAMSLEDVFSAKAFRAAKATPQSAKASSIYPLSSGMEAFAARLLLVDQSTSAIDLQYYIWHRDLTGLLLLEALHRAAERGVKLRLLVDDNGVEDLDDILGEIAAHPNFSVRLYNPFVIRKPKTLNYLFDFFRLNRRMHNKSLTVDGRISLTGGRNIGDEYFDTGSQPTFVDLDVVVMGDAAITIERDFERYWVSRSAYDLNLIVASSPKQTGSLSAALEKAKANEQFAQFSSHLEMASAALIGALNARDTANAPAILISDAPDKTLGSTLTGGLLIDQLAALLDEVEESFDLVSPYFVPGRRGLRQLSRLAQRGVRVRVLTNSLEANDVSLVHAGYAKYRRRLLNAGVELFEMKSQSAPDVRSGDAGTIGSSGSSLHAKTFAADCRRIFVGSFNFDPRSVWLNTEMGLLIDSRQLASRMHAVLDSDLDRISYRLSLDPRGRLQWKDPESGQTFQFDPHSGRVERTSLWFLGKLPIEWLL